MIRAHSRTAGWLLAGWAAVSIGALASPATAQLSEDALAPSAYTVSARQVLGRALDNLHGYDEIQRLDFIVKAPRSRPLTYQAEILRKRIDGVHHTLMRIVGDSDVRAARTLRIEYPTGRIENFVWAPALRRVRRLTLAQRADTLVGSDVSIEDFVVHHLYGFEILARTSSTIDGEPVHIVTVSQPGESAYDRADFFVAQQDFALLEVRFYHRGATDAYKVMRARREDMMSMHGFVVPRRITFYNRDRRSHTELHYRTRLINPQISDRLFVKSALESRRPLIKRSLETPQQVGE